MNDELILFGDGLDQSLPTGEEFAWVSEQVDQRIDKAIQHADLHEATRLVQQLIKIAKVSGRELTKVLYRFYQNWAVFQTEEDFLEWADRETGLHRHTVERYIRVESVFAKPSIPDEVKAELSERNLAELFPVANMVAQGYEPTAEQWQDILLQPDETSVRKKVMEIKGQEPRSTALMLSVDGSGALWATKDGVRKYVGHVEVEDEHPIVQQAVERLLRNAGVLR